MGREVSLHVSILHVLRHDYYKKKVYTKICILKTDMV